MNIWHLVKHFLSSIFSQKRHTDALTYISAERAVLLQEKYFQYSFRGLEADNDFFKTITSPIEYHYIAHIYNWDDGHEVLSWIVNSPICDQATAKLIFWRSQPSYYTRFTTVQEASFDSEIFVLVRTIVEHLQKAAYANSNIYYNPAEDPGAEDIAYQDPKVKWQIPDFMKAPSPGEKISFESIYPASY